MPFRHLYPAFAAGYLLSYFFRNVNAVISPELTREFSLSPGAVSYTHLTLPTNREV